MTDIDTSTDVVTLHALYGFARSITINLDTADFEWLETNADAVVYVRDEADIPVGLWLAEGFKFELLDVRLVSADDPRAAQTEDGPVPFILRN